MNRNLLVKEEIFDVGRDSSITWSQLIWIQFVVIILGCLSWVKILLSEVKKRITEKMELVKSMNDYNPRVLDYRMPARILDFQIEDVSKIVDWIRQLIKEGRTLVYFASGNRVSKEYKNLDYENVILVDYLFSKCVYDGKKIFTLGLDSLVVVKVLKELNVKIDCLVVANEGLSEGGGKYPLSLNEFLGYCFPLFTDKFIFIGSADYYYGDEYSNLREHFLDLPFKNKRLVSEIEKEYISPIIFSPEEGHSAEVFELEGKSDIEHTFQCGGITVHVKHGSIWEFDKELDAIFISPDTHYQKDVIEKLEPKVIDLGQFSKRHSTYTETSKFTINELSKLYEYERIGFVSDDVCFFTLSKYLSKEINGLREIYFFHLNRDDLKYLYKEKSMKRKWELSEALCIYWDFL